MITFAVLMSGFSRRFGKNKLLFEIDSKPMYLYIIETLESMVIKYPDKFAITVVSKYSLIKDECTKRGIKYIQNNESEKGMSASIVKAAENTDTEYVMFFAGDMPYIKKETIEKFISGFLKSKKGIGCTVIKGIIMIPAVFDMRYKKELISLSGDCGAKSIIKQHMDDVFEFYADENEFKDIDCFDDWCRRHNKV